MARTDPTIYMRIPADLKDRLDQAAEENKRSLTAEVVARLEQSLSVQVNPVVEVGAAFVIDRLDEMQKLLDGRVREDALLRLKYMRQGLTTQEMIYRDRVERERERLQRMEEDSKAADFRGDKVASKRLRAKLREDQKFLRTMEVDLENVQLELREAEAKLMAFESGDPSFHGEPAADAGRKVVLVGNIGRAAPETPEKTTNKRLVLRRKLNE